MNYILFSLKFLLTSKAFSDPVWFIHNLSEDIYNFISIIKPTKRVEIMSYILFSLKFLLASKAFSDIVEIILRHFSYFQSHKLMLYYA